MGRLLRINVRKFLCRVMIFLFLGSIASINFNTAKVYADNLVQKDFISIADTFVEFNSPDVNFGDNLTMISRHSDEGNYTRSSYIKFDISELPEITNTDSVMLKLYLTSISSIGGEVREGEVGVYGLANDDWDEYELTANKNADVSERLLLAAFPFDPTTELGKWIEFDVTDFVNEQLSDNDKIVSFMLDNTHKLGTGLAFFATKEGFKKPTLEVKYLGAEDISETVKESDNADDSDTSKTIDESDNADDSDSLDIGVSTEGLVSYWKFDEGSGTIAKDASGNGHDGTLFGAEFTDIGINGGALSSDGISSYVDCGIFNIEGEAMTISAWFYAEDYAIVDGRIISKAVNIEHEDHHWMVSTIQTLSGIKLRYRLKTLDHTTTLVQSSGDALEAKKWIHVAAVYDGSTMKIYKNGEEVASEDKTGPIDTDDAVPVWIANNPFNGTNTFNGKIDELMVFSRALSIDEIQILADGGSGLPTWLIIVIVIVGAAIIVFIVAKKKKKK